MNRLYAKLNWNADSYIGNFLANAEEMEPSDLLVLHGNNGERCLPQFIFIDKLFMVFRLL